MGLLRCLIRVMSEHREEQGSTIPKMSNSRHILILTAPSRNRCAHCRQDFHHSPGKVLAGSSLMQSLLLTLNYSQPGAAELQEQGCAAGAALGQPRTGKCRNGFVKFSKPDWKLTQPCTALCANSEVSCAASGSPWNGNHIVEREIELETSFKKNQIF